MLTNSSTSAMAVDTVIYAYFHHSLLVILDQTGLCVAAKHINDLLGFKISPVQKFPEKWHKQVIPENQTLSECMLNNWISLFPHLQKVDAAPLCWRLEGMSPLNAFNLHVGSLQWTIIGMLCILAMSSAAANLFRHSAEQSLICWIRCSVHQMYQTAVASRARGKLQHEIGHLLLMFSMNPLIYPGVLSLLVFFFCSGRFLTEKNDPESIKVAAMIRARWIL